ncbi:leucyl/phenylalanyl-tRNA--protein transferase [Palleronia sediminis]|uniref:Leucyl/phenylalanyl-tRNA--protein transferase n=1 Tax=Palleronia sediminis TaxID=2547833 RepID=A0A4R6ABK8_9RHOB|nr:leucyl/phenylalanyl-tRNA--protein transferase [Palleronia sediminis]TDL79708.1 leucyl/phenylalanyl-tRNA--protein transferase [Palleronia sediminis]
MTPALTPEIVLQAYMRGIFPMADHRDAADVFWVEPRMRGILPLDGLHVSRSLARRIRARPFAVSYDRDFAGVVAGCADRAETWINAPLVEIYSALHAGGFAHSIELWEGDALVGGVFGIAIGGAFFGESMFSRRTDASKIALVYLVDRLREGGFRLFDTQFITPHLATLGAVEIPREDYRAQLAEAIARRARFDPAPPEALPAQVMQRRTQTS